MTDQHDTQEQGGHEGVGHLVPARYLIITCAALLVLTGLTVVMAGIDFGVYGLPDLNIIVALSIAVVKASLVCLFFMHLFWDRPFNAFIIVTSLVFVGLMIAFTMTDTFEFRETLEQFRITELKGGDSLAVQERLAEIELKSTND